MVERGTLFDEEREARAYQGQSIQNGRTRTEKSRSPWSYDDKNTVPLCELHRSLDSVPGDKKQKQETPRPLRWESILRLCEGPD